MQRTNFVYFTTHDRYGFNGMSKDDELKGDGNSYDFGARMLDTRLGRWLTIDPKAGKYPDLSPYVFCANNPIIFIDPDGKKFVNPYTQMVVDAKLKLTTAQAKFEELKSNHQGELRNKDLKKYEKESGLNSAQNELKENEAKYQLVNDLLYTLSITNPTEYNYFETLKDASGSDVLINVNIKKSGPKPANAITTGIGTFEDPNNPGSVYPTSMPTGIDIILYTANPSLEDPITHQISYLRGDNYPSFCNELGDIKFMFTTVVDQKTLAYQQSTCTPYGPKGVNGYNDPNGAGQFSFQYEFDRKKEVKDYAKSSLQTGETHNVEKGTIQKR